MLYLFKQLHSAILFNYSTLCTSWIISDIKELFNETGIFYIGQDIITDLNKVRFNYRYNFPIREMVAFE